MPEGGVQGALLGGGVQGAIQGGAAPTTSSAPPVDVEYQGTLLHMRVVGEWGRRCTAYCL